MSSLPLTETPSAIMHSAAFRMTLRFAVLFVAGLLFLNLALGLTARWIVEQDIASEVEEQLGRMTDIFDDGGATALAKYFRENFDEGEEDLLLGHQREDGALISGMLAVPRPQIGWSVVTPEGVDDDEALWVKSAWLYDGTWITAGASSETYHDISELMFAGAIWTVAIAFPLALLSGALLSRTIMRRLGRIAATAEGVREGELSRRAPHSGTGDEFDRLAADINAMLDTIETLTRNLRNVSVGIAHELRTPLARIRNRLEDMKDRPHGREEERQAIDGALNEIDAVLVTFDALLKIGQIEADSRRRGFELVNLSELVAEVADVYEPVAAEHGKNLNIKLAGEVTVRGNRALLMQMISNLLDNAIEHTPAHTNITLELSSAGGHRTLVVEDDGPGVPSEEAERVFDRFYRLDRSRAKPGNGLGLCLVRSICGLHGFTARLDPEAGGARFEITI